MSSLQNRVVKLEVEPSADDGGPNFDNLFVNNVALDSGRANNSGRSESKDIPDQIVGHENKIQEYTRLHAAIRQQESQLQQSKNELSTLHQELPARLLEAKRAGESEERQNTLAELAAASEFGRRAFDTLAQSHLEQLRQARLEAYEQGYRDGKQEKERKLHFDAQNQDAKKWALTTIYDKWGEYYTDALPSLILRDDDVGVDVLVLLAKVSEKTTSEHAVKLLLGEIARRNQERNPPSLQPDLTKADLQNVLDRLNAGR